MAAPTSRAPAIPRSRLPARPIAISAAALLTLGAILPGVLVRAFHTFSADFPLNDGGLFYIMARDLQANHYILPAYTTYNAEGIPFAYPPLGIYVAALADDLFPFSLTTAFRILPFVFTVLTLVAFLQLARRMLRTEVAALSAVIAFGFIPRSFIWLLMGGGMTRALGLMFAIFALAQVHTMYTRGTRRSLVLASVLGALAVASHLEAGWFLCYSTAIFFLAYSRNAKDLTDSMVFAGFVALLTAPWWLWVVAQHGLEPFTASAETGGTILGRPEMLDSLIRTMLSISTTSETFFPVIAALGLLGAFICLATGRLLFLPLWWIVIILLDLRAFATYASVPIALLAGIAVADGILPILRRAMPDEAPVAPEGRARSSLAPHWKGLVLLSGFLYFLGMAAIDDTGGEQPSMQALSPGAREAMHWVASETPADARFAVIPTRSWEVGREAEWFPALTSRVSVATVQGNEWLPNRAFDRTISDYNGLWGCGGATATCLDEWSAATGRAFNYVYLPEGCCSALETSLEFSYRYEKVYDRDGQVIFERLQT